MTDRHFLEHRPKSALDGRSRTERSNMPTPRAVYRTGPGVNPTGRKAVKLRRSAGRMSALGAAVLLVTVSLLVLAGCSAPPERGGPVTLVLKHAKILGPVDPLPRLLTEFEPDHPGIR